MNALLDQTTDIFCEKLARLDAIGPNRRLIFTVSSVDEPGCHLVAAKLILPADFMVTLAYMAVSADRMTISPELIEAEPRMLTDTRPRGLADIGRPIPEGACDHVSPRRGIGN
jgi:hypothetical protein